MQPELPVWVTTAGNPDTHVVLRGGGGRTNYDRESVHAVAEKLDKRGVMVDCSHGNSKKDPALQGEALREACADLIELLVEGLAPGCSPAD